MNIIRTEGWATHTEWDNGETLLEKAISSSHGLRKKKKEGEEEEEEEEVVVVGECSALLH